MASALQGFCTAIHVLTLIFISIAAFYIIRYFNKVKDSDKPFAGVVLSGVVSLLTFAASVVMSLVLQIHFFSNSSAHSVSSAVPTIDFACGIAGFMAEEKKGGRKEERKNSYKRRSIFFFHSHIKKINKQRINEIKGGGQIKKKKVRMRTICEGTLHETQEGPIDWMMLWIFCNAVSCFIGLWLWENQKGASHGTASTVILIVAMISQIMATAALCSMLTRRLQEVIISSADLQMKRKITHGNRRETRAERYEFYHEADASDNAMCVLNNNKPQTNDKKNKKKKKIGFQKGRTETASYMLSEKPDEDKHEAMISFSNLDSEKQKSIELKPGDSNGTDDFKSPSSVHPNETVSFVTFSGKDQVLVDLLIRYVVLSICSAVTACVTVCVLGYLLTQKYHMSNGIEAFAVILSSQIAFVTICQCF
ncbi:hypothetical protein RFI_04804, partial [Reticulomyxa filosa]